jgi:hypothetical protein
LQLKQPTLLEHHQRHPERCQVGKNLVAEAGLVGYDIAILAGGRTVPLM